MSKKAKMVADRVLHQKLTGLNGFGTAYDGSVLVGGLRVLCVDNHIAKLC